MAYGIKYVFSFKNLQGDIYRGEILEKDFGGVSSIVKAGPRPFLLKYQSGDEQVINAIRASEAEINIYSEEDFSLDDFYSEDDEQFRVDFYCESVNGTALNKLLWQGYIVQDNCQEEFQDPPYIITLNATDGLALLKDVKFNDVALNYLDTLVFKHTLLDYIKVAIKSTGVNLPVRIFSNIFENTQSDRGDDPVNEMFSQTRLFSGMFLDTSNAWQNIYDILNVILFPLNATLIQADGYWNIIRFTEAYLFDSNQIAGTKYDADFANPEAVTLDPNFELKSATDYEFLNADAKKSIIRPFQFVKETFNYKQPQELILGLDLQTLGSFIETETIGDLRYDRYNVNSTWKHEDSDPNGFVADSSYIEVVTDTTTETEIERYLVDPNTSNDYKWLQLTTIEVSAGDYFNFEYSVKARNHTPDAALRISTRFILFTADSKFYDLATVGGTLAWSGPTTIPPGLYKVTIGQVLDIPTESDTEYQDFNLETFVATGSKMPVFPVDGILIIGLDGSNNTLDNGSISKEDVFMKDFKLTFFNRINESLNIIGQTHTTSQDDNIKNNFDEEINIDDSPRNTIAGTLYTNAITTFSDNIGDIYFTKTQFWHRLQNDEALRLGQLTTFERKLLTFISRTVIEGTYTGIRYGEAPYKFISPLNIIQIFSLPGLNFLMGICSIDFMNAVFSATLQELYKDTEDDESLTSTYEFKYLYQTN